MSQRAESLLRYTRSPRAACERWFARRRQVQPGVIPSVEWNTTPTRARESHRARSTPGLAREPHRAEKVATCANHPSGPSSQMRSSSFVAAPEIEMFELGLHPDHARTCKEARRLKPHRDVPNCPSLREGIASSLAGITACAERGALRCNSADGSSARCWAADRRHTADGDSARQRRDELINGGPNLTLVRKKDKRIGTQEFDDAQVRANRSE